MSTKPMDPLTLATVNVEPVAASRRLQDVLDTIDTIALNFIRDDGMKTIHDLIEVARSALVEGRDRLPVGHRVLEQADTLDGRVSQTVRIDATGEEYERIVHSSEAYGDDE